MVQGRLYPFPAVTTLVMSEMRHFDQAFLGNQRVFATGAYASTLKPTFNVVDIT